MGHKKNLSVQFTEEEYAILLPNLESWTRINKRRNPKVATFLRALALEWTPPNTHKEVNRTTSATETQIAQPA